MVVVVVRALTDCLPNKHARSVKVQIATKPDANNTTGCHGYEQLVQIVLNMTGC